MHPLFTLLLPLLALLGSAVGNSKSNLDYAPTTNVQCPDVSAGPLIRVFTPQSQSLHPDEDTYVKHRRANVIPNAWKDWLGDASQIGYDLSTLQGAYPQVAIALSGGGYRAAQYGAAVLNALDGRNTSAKSAGTGGLLQVASYLGGLSGGAWLTGSLYANNWPSAYDMVLGDGKDGNGWLLDLDLVIPDGTNIFSKKNQKFFDSIMESVYAKAKKGM
jgi:lysophospholipase